MAICPWLVYAQFEMRGKVFAFEKFLIGASVSLQNSKFSTSTDVNGEFIFNNVDEETYDIIVSNIGYETFKQRITIPTNSIIRIELKPSVNIREEVIVSAIKAKKLDAGTFSNLSKIELNENNTGQDLPYLLQNTPSVVVNSDAGAGIGYTGLRIRGSDATRINMTINGIPFNDSESQNLFLVNLPDFASSINSLQIQRGVGSSTNGSAAFGASINIQTTTINTNPYVEINSSTGSFNTLKNTLSFGTGLTNNNWSVDGRLSRIVSDGYIDRGSSELKSFFTSLSHIGKKDFFKVNIFSGAEKTYQSWYGVPESRINNDTAAISAFIARNYLDEKDANNLRNSGRNYNFYTYDNQTDNYQQDHYQTFYNRQITSKLNAQIALHLTRGKGYYEEYRNQDDLANYFLSPAIIGMDTVLQSDVIRRRWLDNYFYGTTFSTTYQPNNNVEIIAGGGYNEYNGLHYGELIWSKVVAADSIRKKYYEDDAFKTDFTIYSKISYKKNKAILFADLQYRKVTYTNKNVLPGNATLLKLEPMNFFNPKIGITYILNDSISLYLTGAISNKEINREEFTNSTLQSRPKPERLYNLEAGYRINSKKYRMEVNLFYMNYKNQLVLTGQVNDVGAYIRQNTPTSYRTGLEVSGNYSINKDFEISANATISENRIKNFTSFIDDYDVGGQQKELFSNSAISFSPALTAGLQIKYNLVKAFSATLMNRYVSRQFLDNTENIKKSIDPYLVNDIKFNYLVKSNLTKELGLFFTIQNVLNNYYEANGYTFSYISGSENITENFYYPQAGRNFMMGVSVKF